jgi:hypothetical protein
VTSTAATTSPDAPCTTIGRRGGCGGCRRRLRARDADHRDRHRDGAGRDGGPSWEGRVGQACAAEQFGAATKARGASSAARGRVACDANITVKAATTSCPFGQNVFYGFWKAQDDGDDAFRAYSPVSKRSYEMTCTSGVTVVCRAGDGGEVRFSRASVDAYDTAQAARYAATHDTGPADDAGPAAGGRGAGSGQADAAAGSDCDSSYEGACLEPDALDYDCAGGSGDGPEYTDTVRVVGDDHYDLDRDGDGVACDS